jgi:hypothetical protein
VKSLALGIVRLDVHRFHPANASLVSPLSGCIERLALQRLAERLMSA